MISPLLLQSLSGVRCIQVLSTMSVCPSFDFSGFWLPIDRRGEVLRQHPVLAISLDDLVCAREHTRRHVQAERLRGLEVNDEFDFRDLLYRQISRLVAAEDAAVPPLFEREKRLHARGVVSFPLRTSRGRGV